MPKGIYNHKPHSEETRKKIGEKSKGRRHSEESKKKMGKLGESHPRWMGENAKKISKHEYVAKHKPKSKTCEFCGQERRLALANIRNHNYTKDINDYKWLCYSCHSHLDKNKEVCKLGHELKGNNIIINNRGHRVCRECRKLYSQRYRSKKLMEVSI